MKKLLLMILSLLVLCGCSSSIPVIEQSPQNEEQQDTNQNILDTPQNSQIEETVHNFPVTAITGFFSLDAIDQDMYVKTNPDNTALISKMEDGIMINLPSSYKVEDDIELNVRYNDGKGLLSFPVSEDNEGLTTYHHTLQNYPIDEFNSLSPVYDTKNVSPAYLVVGEFKYIEDGKEISVIFYENSRLTVTYYDGFQTVMADGTYAFNNDKIYPYFDDTQIPESLKGVDDVVFRLSVDDDLRLNPENEHIIVADFPNQFAKIVPLENVNGYYYIHMPAECCAH